MPRIKLAFWHGDKRPGEEIDVTDEDLAALRRDGRVATVLTAPPLSADEAAAENATDDAQASPEEPVAPPESRTRRAR